LFPRPGRDLWAEPEWLDRTWFLLCDYVKRTENRTVPAEIWRLLLARVQTPWSGAQLRNEQRAAQHGHVLHEVDHLHLAHHGVSDRPEVMQHGRDADQEQCDEPCAELGAVAEQDQECTENGDDARKRHGDRSQRHALRRGEGDRLAGEIVRA